MITPTNLNLATSRLLGPAPVLEFTFTLMDDWRLDWQFMNFSGRRWAPVEIRTLLIRCAQALPCDTPPVGGTPGAEAALGMDAPSTVPLPVPAEILHQEAL